MALTVAGRVVPDPMEIWQDYARRTRTLHGYDLAGTGDPAILTASEVERTWIIASRISRKECVRLVNRAAGAPWAFVAVDADLADADPSRRGGLFDQAAALYWHFTTPHEAGLGPAKIHKVLHVKRPSVYPASMIHRYDGLACSVRPDKFLILVFGAGVASGPAVASGGRRFHGRPGGSFLGGRDGTSGSWRRQGEDPGERVGDLAVPRARTPRFSGAGGAGL